MFDELERMIDGLEIPVDGAAITKLARLQSRLNARFATAVGAFDAAGLYELDHDVSLRRWLANHCELTDGDAGQLTRTAKRAHRYPTLAAAWMEGRVSDGQVHAVVAQLTERRLPVFDEMVDEVIGELEGLDVRGTVTVMGLWAERADAVLADQLDREPDDTLHFSRTLDGRGVLSGSFGTESREIIERALGLATQPDGPGDSPTTPAERRANALVDVHRFFLDHHDVSVLRGSGRR